MEKGCWRTPEQLSPPVSRAGIEAGKLLSDLGRPKFRWDFSNLDYTSDVQFLQFYCIDGDSNDKPTAMQSQSVAKSQC